MSHSKWGDVDLDDGIPLDPGNVSEWYAVLSLIESAFERNGHLEETYHVVEERFRPHTAQVVLQHLEEFTPDRTWALAVEIRRALRCYKHYWLVGIGIFGEDTKLSGLEDVVADVDEELAREMAALPRGEFLTWIEIDKYAIYPYSGMVIINRFENMAKFFQKYWGKDFDFPP
jgi:hypothetical protein